MKVFCTIVIFALLIACSSEKSTSGDGELGTISFEVNGSEEAREHFEKGLLLLHSFEYRDARKKFIEAHEADPDFAMAYWGHAMTYNHPLWRAQYTDEAREALALLADTPEERVEKAVSPIEKDFMRAVNILYSEEIEEKLDRDKAYAAEMKRLYKEHQGNHEVAAFYALSLLGATPERKVANYEKGAIIVQGVLAENPDHPGALHYLIHSYDDPDHAHLALDAADSYSKVAPDAGHALHMPSHIYLALGMWDEVISSNIASFDASEARKERLDLDSDARNYHALHWLMYGYLQKDMRGKAREKLEDMISYHDELPSPRSRGYLTEMRATYLVDTEDWDDPATSIDIDDSELNVTFKATNNFIRGMVAYDQNEIQILQEVIDTMREQRLEAGKDLMQRGASMCSNLTWFTQLPTQSDVDIAHVMEMELEAMLALLDEDIDKALDLLSVAAALEDKTSYMFGPPAIPKPAHELYAEVLVKAGKLDKAKEHVEKALEKTPGRRIPVNLKTEIEKKYITI